MRSSKSWLCWQPKYRLRLAKRGLGTSSPQNSVLIAGDSPTSSLQAAGPSMNQSCESAARTRLYPLAGAGDGLSWRVLNAADAKPPGPVRRSRAGRCAGPRASIQRATAAHELVPAIPSRSLGFGRRTVSIDPVAILVHGPHMTAWRPEADVKAPSVRGPCPGSAERSYSFGIATSAGSARAEKRKQSPALTSPPTGSPRSAAPCRGTARSSPGAARTGRDCCGGWRSTAYLPSSAQDSGSRPRYRVRPAA